MAMGAYRDLEEDPDEPTLEQEYAGRMDAADRAARLEDQISRRRQERRLVKAMATPPAAGATPDLDQLRELLAAATSDGRTNLPWWLDSTPGGDEDGFDGTIHISGGIVAGYERTEHDHEGNAIGTEPAIEELGMLHPQTAGALAVAAVNALPWLLDEVDRLRAAVALVRRLNRPMQEQLRRAAADTSPNWDVTAIIYPPSAQGLVALIDALRAVDHDPAPKRTGVCQCSTFPMAGGAADCPNHVPGAVPV